MLMQNNQITFVEVQFFNLSSPFTPDEESESFQVQKETLMEKQSLVDHEIFIENSSFTDTGSDFQSLKKKSILHNFQKHLFTFIQHLIPKNTEQKDVEHDKVQKCMEKIFKLIKMQKKKTRQQLVPIFGQMNMRKINRTNQNYQSLLIEFSEDILKQSLLKVRNYFLQKIKQGALKEYVQRSKIQKKREFQKYMQSFVCQVEENRFSCRLSKKSQDQIRQKINEEIKYNEWKNLIV